MWFVIDDAQITNIAILPEYRGKKIGEKLFEYTCQQAMKMGVKRLSLEVRMSNVDRKSTRLNSSHVAISYAVFCVKKKTEKVQEDDQIDRQEAITTVTGDARR